LAGIFFLLVFAWTLSSDRKAMNWRVIIWGLVIQLVFAAFVFLFPPGTALFLIINDAVIKVLESAGNGSRFLFGRLAIPPGGTGPQGEESLGFFLAFQAMPAVVFFASLMGLLYYMGIMGRIIRGFSFLFSRLMKISGAESLCASSNIFVGIESALTIRPYLKEMTSSELCTILTAGMGTVASSVLALYVILLEREFANIAGHLVSASILSAPAAVVMSKIIMPEKERPVTLGVDVTGSPLPEKNWIEAIINGANSGIKLVAGIVALLIAFLGLVALGDLMLGYVGGWVNQLLGLDFEWSLKGIAGIVFYPFTLAIGIPLADVGIISDIIGERLVVTEVQSYMDLSRAIASGTLQHQRSAVITTYALCGFAHVASLAIFVGGIAALVPSRTSDLTKVGPRALLAATLACLMTAAVAGAFFHGSSLLLS
jgi:CNT family concentrative nucleoside transporter